LDFPDVDVTVTLSNTKETIGRRWHMKVKFPIVYKDSEVIGEHNVKNLKREDTPTTRNGIRLEGFFVGDTADDGDCAIWVKSQLPNSPVKSLFFNSIYAEPYVTESSTAKKDWGIGIKESEDLQKQYKIDNGLVPPKPEKKVKPVEELVEEPVEVAPVAEEPKEEKTLFDSIAEEVDKDEERDKGLGED
jgi:hypothetical protein